MFAFKTLTVYTICIHNPEH